VQAAPLLDEHDVLGLEVAMGDPLGVGRCNPITELDDEVERVVAGQAASLAKLLSQRRPLDVLHDEIVEAMVLSKIGDIDDMTANVADSREELWLKLEAFDICGLLRVL